MKKSHRFIHLALTCLAFASVAHAEDKYVTPVQEQERFETATRLPEMDKACKMHMDYLRNGDEFVNSLLKSADGCKKQIGSIMDKAIQESADACMSSFDPTTRNVMKKNLNRTFEVQGLQCTERDALLAPCPECNDTIMSVGPVFTTMSTLELDRTLGVYIDFDVKELRRGKWVPKVSKLEILARQYGCRDFDLNRAVSTIVSYENELISGAQIKVKAYVKGPLRRPPEIEQEAIPGPRYIGKSRRELAPVRIAGGSNGSLNGANTQKDSSTPQAVTVTDLGNGNKAYVYQDAKHKDQNLVGVEIVDSKTGAKKTLAFPVSAEDAAKIANAKDPITCLNLISRAQEEAAKNGYTPEDALKNGEKLTQKLAAQNDAQEKAKLANGNSANTNADNANGSDDPSANATGQADGKNVTQADSAPTAGKVSGVPIIDKSMVHKSAATASDAEPSDGKTSTASMAPDSTAEAKDPISPEYRVGQGIGPSNGVKIDGMGTGTGLKFGGGVGLRGTQKMQSPSQVPQGDHAAAQLDQSTAQAAGSDQTDPDHAATPEQAFVNDLSSRGSLSEPNGVEYKPNSALTQTGAKSGAKADSTQARNPGQELATNLSSRTSLSEPNGVPGHDVDSPQAGAKNQDSNSGSSQRSSSTAAVQASSKDSGKTAVKKKSKPMAKAQASAKKSTQAATNKPALKAATKATPKKPTASHTGFTFTSENIGRVRYFLVNKPPYKAYVGRVIEVNGKTQVMMYNTGADVTKLSSMSHDPRQLKAEFLKQNTGFQSGTSLDNLASGISNRELEDVLINQVLKR